MTCQEIQAILSGERELTAADSTTDLVQHLEICEECGAMVNHAADQLSAERN